MSTSPSFDPTLALAVVHAYHQRTKHRFDGYARGPEALDWDAQPAPFRHFDGAPVVALPRLSHVAEGSALQVALQRPFGRLADAATLPPALDTLGALLQLSLGITAWKSFGPDRWALRANPSSGNLHPVEAYLQVRGFDGLVDGLYHYRPDDHALELRATHPGAAGGGTQLAVVLTSVMWREAWKYGERAFRYCQLDVGHAAGALRYAAAVLGWTLGEQAQVGSATLAALAGVDRLQDFPFTRVAEAEQEEAEMMLALGFDGNTPPALSSEALRALAAGAMWHGVASMVDRHPLHHWPAIGEVAAATRSEGVQGFSPPLSRGRSGGGWGHQGRFHSATHPIPTPALPLKGREYSFSRRRRTLSPAVAALLTGRRSAQRFDARHVMPLADFAAIVARLQPGAELPWDTLAAEPCAALVLFVHRVAGLTPGLYLLPRAPRLAAALLPDLAARFSLRPVAGIEALLHLADVAPTELQRLARSLHCHQDIASSACFALGMLCQFDAALVAGPAAYRTLYREAGLVGQVLYLEAEAHGLRGTGVGCFFDDPVHSVLGLEGSAWQTLYHFTVGRPIDDARIESSPAYADD